MATRLYRILPLLGMALPVTVYAAAPVPGYVAPIAQTPVQEYVDDTRGLFIPAHTQLRAKTERELAAWQETINPAAGAGLTREQSLNRLATGEADTASALNRIANDPGLLNGAQVAQANFAQPRRPAPERLSDMPSLATGGQARMTTEPVDSPNLMVAEVGRGGRILATGPGGSRTVDLQNGIVRINEERITVRRALQRMLDQVGGSDWTVVWDLDNTNASLPEMEISLRAEEPFIKVLNAMLARLQSRSGQPLKVIKYDATQRLVITDRANAGGGDDINAQSAGFGPAITETVLKENRISLHYDEVPLVDALENMVNQAGKGQWRLRMYAGTDQVLKPAHIEEPFGVAIERVLRVFNLRYEIFPGGKLIVVTAGDSFGFRGVEP